MPLPVAPAMQAIGVGERVPGLVAHELEAVFLGAALDFEHHVLFETLEARVREIKGNGETGDAVGRKPFIRQPAVRAELKAV